MSLNRYLTLVALAFVLLSCGQEEQAETPDAFSALAGPYLGQTLPGLTPELFAPGLISTDRDEAGLTAGPGGEEIFFWRVEPVEGGGTPQVTIYITREVDGGWTPPEAAPFSGEFMDAYPALSPDGSRLFFQSDRPMDPAESEFEYNIWYADREEDGWSEAKPLGRPINGRNHTGGPSVTRDGTMYFTLMDFESGVQELYRSEFVEGAYQEPVRLPDAVNASLQNFDSYVDPDERYLIFSTFERQGHTDNPGDMKIAYRDQNGEWGPAVSLGLPIRSEDQSGSVTISGDGKFIFFQRTGGPTGDSRLLGTDVFWVDASVVAREAGGADTVLALADAFWDAWATVEVDRGLSFFAEDATAVTKTGAILRGRAAIDAAWRPGFATITGQVIEIRDAFVTEFGDDLATLHQTGTFLVHRSDGTTEGPIPFTYATTWLLRDGAWKIVAAHRTDPPQS